MGGCLPVRTQPGRGLQSARVGLQPLVLWLVFAVAFVSTLGSLYLSEVARFVPCTLCWYQRIAMYPLALLLGIAAVRGDIAVRRHAVPLAGIGALIAAYHVALQRLPGLPSGTCSLDVPCSAIYVERFGFVTSRTARSRGMPRRSQPSAVRRSPTLAVIGGIVTVVILAAAVALLASTAPSGLAEPASRKLVIAGAPLPAMPQSGTDAAAGQLFPSISGTGLDGEPVQIGPDAGAQAIVVLAHWCLHCQAELPVLTEWLASNQPPAGVRVVALSTAIDAARPNYPPSAWLEREGWTQPTLVDDAGSTGLAALGVSTFPAFVFMNPDGTVASRLTGEIGADQFAAALNAIAP